MATRAQAGDVLDGLNESQRQAVEHDKGPLLIIAGAGTGKTRTLVHRVAHRIAAGVDPGRMLLLTFTRRAAAEMLRRVDGLLRQLGRLPDEAKHSPGLPSQKGWGGTFHATAARLLRIHGKSIGLDPSFTIHDQGDAADLLDVVRTELGLAKTDKRFPKKGTCLAIYSHAVNSQRPLEEVLGESFPWCGDYASQLKALFSGYVDRKERSNVLDYDDLLLFWLGLMEDGRAGELVRGQFDQVFVDEYQDTNRLQAGILKQLCPDGTGLTVVGDDAQSIYSFRAATIRNILDFPAEYPGATVVKLEQNYRSTPPILEATNCIMSQAAERFTKDLWSLRKGRQRPLLVTSEDEAEQAEFVAGQILEHREAGIDLRKQAVLFRASHHSILLEAELARRNIPFVKYGGLKFTETAHVKDFLAYLRLVENPRDLIAGTRILMLLPGIGPKKARQLMDQLLMGNGNFRVWLEAPVPAASSQTWQELVNLLVDLSRPSQRGVAVELQRVRAFYGPLLEETYDHPEPRRRDLEQVEQLASRFSDRRSFLAETTLDPPATTEDFAGKPLLDEDYLILSTIHSAKGLEWDAVYVIHAADGNIPSDLATGTTAQIDEERRLFYVALTRAKDWLYVCHPLRYYHVARGPFSDRYGHAPLTRFVTDEVKQHFDSRFLGALRAGEGSAEVAPRVQESAIRQRSKAMWK